MWVLCGVYVYVGAGNDHRGVLMNNVSLMQQAYKLRRIKFAEMLDGREDMYDRCATHIGVVHEGALVGYARLIEGKMPCARHLTEFEQDVVEVDRRQAQCVVEISRICTLTHGVLPELLSAIKTVGNRIGVTRVVCLVHEQSDKALARAGLVWPYRSTRKVNVGCVEARVLISPFDELCSMVKDSDNFVEIEYEPEV